MFKLNKLLTKTTIKFSCVFCNNKTDISTFALLFCEKRMRINEDSTIHIHLRLLVFFLNRNKSKSTGLIMKYVVNRDIA